MGRESSGRMDAGAVMIAGRFFLFLSLLFTFFSDRVSLRVGDCRMDVFVMVCKVSRCGESSFF